jgi:hypothetical protein
VLAVVAAAAACSDASTAESSADSAPRQAAVAPTSPPQAALTAPPTADPTPAQPRLLPRGGLTIFPRYRVVAHYGSEGGPALGVLGAGTPEQAARRILVTAAAYARSGRPVLPAMELIATVATAGAGPDRQYSHAISASTIDRFLAAARRHRMLLILDVQPGRSEFITQVRSLRRWLVQPDVGVALDPEWKLAPGERPLHRVGSTSAAAVNEVSAYVAALVAQYQLPEKVFVVHQFQVSMVRQRGSVVSRPGLAMVFHVDGQGPVGEKLATYRALRVHAPFHMGFKLFYTKDPVMMSPAGVMALRPQPEFITYQ